MGDWIVRKSTVYSLLTTLLYMEKSAWINACVMRILARVFRTGSRQKKFTYFLTKYALTLAVSGTKSCR